MELLALTDLVERWHYSKCGIHKLSKSSDFPKPIATVCKGRIKIFAESDMRAYEKDKPWLLDENQKRQRQKLFFAAQGVEESETA